MVGDPVDGQRRPPEPGGIDTEMTFSVNGQRSVVSDQSNSRSTTGRWPLTEAHVTRNTIDTGGSYASYRDR